LRISPSAGGNLLGNHSLPLPYHCIFLLGFETTSFRVAIHSGLGSGLYGTFLDKVIIVRNRRVPAWALPVAGALVFAIVLGLWLTSSLYFFGTHAIAL